MKKNTTKVIKEANKYLVMQCIQAFEPVTLEKIAEKTLLSRPTILEIINSFKEEGIVVNGGFRESDRRTASAVAVHKWRFCVCDWN